MSYAILRTAKLTSLGNVGGSAQHNFRERKTENADPERTPSNITSGAQSSKEVIAAVKARLETVPTVRKNAVLAVEYFIGASPQWFKEQSPKAREAYFDEAEKWLKAHHGAENVIAFTRQYDETSPHACAYVVPIDPKGKLNCSHFLDGRTKLSEMQTEFAEKVGRRFNLERGIEGSQAKHQTIKEYYAKIQSPTPKLKTQIPEVPKATTSQKMAEAVGIATDHSRALEQQEAARQKRAAEFRAMREAEQAKANQYELEKAANKAREARLSELRATAIQARALPLAAVLERLGATPDPSDKKNWKTPTGRISVDGSKFFNHDTAKGGGGAIDLVMLQTETDYKGAVNWLAREFGTGAVLAETVAKLKPTIEAMAKKKPSLDPMKPHQPDPSHWDTVRGYLVETRRLGARIVDSLHAQGHIYADKFKNAVFLLGKGQGLSLRGTGEKQFHGVRGEKVPFILTASDKASQKVAFVESPIDALSLRDLGFGGRIVATVGNAAELAKATADIYRKEGLTVVAAFDNDRAGDAMARSLGQCERMKPTRKDWNQDLRAQRLTPAERQALDLDLEQKHERARSRRPSVGM
jgi:5S rRNA maturation endonuclease (ribonuclease M5)